MIKLKPMLCEWTGESWNSCQQWFAHRAKFQGDEAPAQVAVYFSSRLFSVTYRGPGSGLSISHGKGGSGDTLHQVFNIVVCELNPRIHNLGVRPINRSITSDCTRVGDEYMLRVTVPLAPSDRSWNLTHRGSWGGDPGESVISGVPGYRDPHRDGPARHVTEVPGGNSIYTYFLTYPV